MTMENAWPDPAARIDAAAPRPERDVALHNRYPRLIDRAREPIYAHNAGGATTELRPSPGAMDFDALPNPVILTDASGVVTGWNAAAEERFGFTAREALGMALPTVPPEEAEQFDNLLGRALRGETVNAVAVERLDSTGARLPLLLSAAPWRERGAIVGALLTFTDRAAEQARERELVQQVTCAERRARDAAYLATIAEACMATDDECALLQSVAEATAVWADSAGVIVCDGDAPTLVAYASHVHDREEAVAALFQAHAAGFRGIASGITGSPATAPSMQYLREVPLTGATLAQGYHTLASAPVRIGDETAAILYVAARGTTAPLDATALATLERAAAHTGTAVAKMRMHHALQARTETLEAAARRKDDFLATVSHELRTPLTAILGFAHIIVENDGLGPERRRGMAEDIVASGGLLLTQVNDLLDIVQLGAGRLTVPLEMVDLSTVLRWCERAVRTLMNSKGLHFDLALPADLPRVRANTARLQQVLLNFLVNAYKFTPSGGTVTLAAAAAGGAVAITVRDTGIGIAPEHAARIFEPFARVETEYTRTQSGAGVGLAVARQLAEMMEGAITLESAPDVGSAFTVSLAVAPE